MSSDAKTREKNEATRPEQQSRQAGAPSTGHRGSQRPGATFKRVLHTVFHYYPAHATVMVVCIIASSVLASVPSIFLQQAIDIVQHAFPTGDWAGAAPKIGQVAAGLITCYVVALAANITYTQLGAIVCQGTLMHVRNEMFDHMEGLPIRYFDTNKHGDIMSHYTNDVDTLRQLIGQSLPNLLTMLFAMVSVLAIMLWYSIPLSAVVLAMVACMVYATRVLGGKSAHYFLDQQIQLAKTEGFAEEAMNGEKVIKVFTHEDKTIEEFDAVNDALYEASRTANTYGNTLMPVLMNMGNLAYVIVALSGVAFLTSGFPNPSISGMALSIAVVVPFLNMTKRFAGSIGQVSQQINFVVMGLAGAERIFSLIDEKPEEDEGYVTLVNVRKNAAGELEECAERTETW
ncbi:MAG: ABC transporter ATP-binding protein, partial [Parafannyhessea umbonata]|nr:ABC transporter ATP-binding protein [Parafannyhessea umbonata]